jgi:hypothetical protein
VLRSDERQQNAGVGPTVEPHPVRLVVTDDLRRTRLTVAVRLILALPHLVWITLFGIAAFTLAFVVWLAVLFERRAPTTLHGFLASFTRYAVHLTAYIGLVADPYPGFTGAGSYPVDVEIAPPAPQGRWGAAFRLVLAVPAFVVASTLGGSVALGSGYGGALAGGAGGLTVTVAFLGWFASLARARMPRGMRDASAYAIGYAAQTTAYALMLTDRYPDSTPGKVEPPPELPAHPIAIAVDEDLRRPRLLVLFRFPLVVPHLVWLTLWAVLVVLAVVAAWILARVLGRVPRALHRFMAAFVRAVTHVGAFFAVVGRQFPGFVGQEGSYPIDLTIDPAERQPRLGVLVRLLLAVPAFLLALTYSAVTLVVALLLWLCALATGRVAPGLRDLGAASLRYQAQAWGYALLLTPRYPDSSPALRPPPATPAAVLLEPGGSA